jgi:hypothetical protein
MERKVGGLTLISYSNGYDWEVYDEDFEFQGHFCGNIDSTSEEEVWEGL